MNRHVRPLSDWWAARTGRERRLAALGAVVLIAALAWVSLDRLDVENQRLAAARQSEFQARRLAARPDSLSDSEAALVAALRGAALEAPSLSLARLSLEQFMADAATRAEIATPTITVAADFEPDHALRLLRAEIAAPYSAEQLLALSEALSDQATWVAIRNVEVTGGTNLDGGRMRLSVLVPVVLIGDEPE